ncbi:hypothetical protein [Streptomyces sp. SID13031]|uniref:hypothetical protein n=1 Tax=Streptomyces sp. SID13031 TaxID=2706046 RepID=UPI0013CD0B7F|nr:hypothetical protein [Streptomyces sp. SID13031]NEA30660.1 hypothetical protein [Streptomyces sp. SID13031]
MVKGAGEWPGWWSAISTMSDADHDDKVSLDELMTVVDQLPAMDEGFPRRHRGGLPEARPQR